MTKFIYLNRVKLCLFLLVLFFSHMWLLLNKVFLELNGLLCADLARLVIVCLLFVHIKQSLLMFCDVLERVK